MRSLVLCAVLMLAGCASAGGGKPPVCDGKHRRPANPYGSMLSPKPEANAPSAPAAPKADRRSALAVAAFGSCA